MGLAHHLPSRNVGTDSPGTFFTTAKFAPLQVESFAITGDGKGENSCKIKGSPVWHKLVSKGTLSDSTRKGWFSKVWDKVTPF